MFAGVPASLRFFSTPPFAKFVICMKMVDNIDEKCTVHYF
ncbi:hypothetical protein B4099_0307 [Heyndrickxia coagulans]|uniref:Uncharacterized protein n=1 Tax=Heyndrickxia coagulans TaxID=1398 RepID=A0A150KG32_HEYCO|nr:hypothetical protein B4099_0307 [Heyndrickxia coagulans]